LHPENTAPNDVLLGPLGSQALGVRAQALEPVPTRTQTVPRGWRTPVARPLDDHCGGCPCGGG